VGANHNSVVHLWADATRFLWLAQHLLLDVLFSLLQMALGAGLLRIIHPKYEYALQEACMPSVGSSKRRDRGRAAP
jgi:hypothetical protein